MLENLISNAVKYHKQDNSVRFIKITGKSHEGYLQLCIQDNGIAITPEHHVKNI